MKQTAKIMILVIMTMALLAGCSKETNISSLLPGTWYPKGSESAAFTLYDDGTCEIEGEYGTGKWSVVSENQLKLENYYGETQIADIKEVLDGKLILADGDNTQTFLNTSCSPDATTTKEDTYANGNGSLEATTITGFTIQDYMTSDLLGNLYYNVSYKTKNSDIANGLMDRDGLITADIPQTYINDGRGFTIYSDSGEHSYIPDGANDFAEIILEYEGVYLVQELRKGLDNSGIYAGLMNNFGQWLNGYPLNTSEIGWTLSKQELYSNLGEGYIGSYTRYQHGNALFLLNVKDGAFGKIENVWYDNLKMYDGSFIYQSYDGGGSGGHKGSIFSYKDGNIIELSSVDGDLISCSEKGILTDNDGLSFYSRDGKHKWTFNKYNIYWDRMPPVMYGDFIFAFIYNNDLTSGVYLACISQETGEITYEPIPASNAGNVKGHVAFVSDDTGNYLVDVTTGKPLLNLGTNCENETKMRNSDGPFIEIFEKWKDHENKWKGKYRLFNGNGEEVVPHLAEKSS